MVDSLSLDDGVAFVHAEDPGYATFAREITDITVTGPGERAHYDAVTLGLVPVSVSHQVIGYLRRRLSGEVIDFVELDMPRHRLETTAAMYTITPEALQDNGISAPRIPGSLHAAEHAAIGLLPLVASCDRGDIGGLSTATGEGACPRCSSTTDIRRCRLRRTRLPAGEHLARRHRRGDRGVRMPAGLPSCAVTQMRERERSLDKPGRSGSSPSFSTNSPRRKVNRGRRPTLERSTAQSGITGAPML